MSVYSCQRVLFNVKVTKPFHQFPMDHSKTKVSCRSFIVSLEQKSLHKCMSEFLKKTLKTRKL